MAVSFERHGVLHYLDPGDASYTVGEQVLFPTDAGPEVVYCVWGPQEVDSKALGELPRCLGKASAADLERDSANRRKRAEAKVVAEALIAEHGLPMKVVGIDFVDRSIEFDQQVVVYFTAPHRVDFRALLGDLARSLQSRIDLRQVAARDAARLLGGVGSCGRDACCATFLDAFEPVSLRVARAQSPSPGPLQVTGCCGRLMCCLRFEHPLYAEFARVAPPIGAQLNTDEGPGTVVGHRVPDGTVLLKLASGDLKRRRVEVTPEKNKECP